jgi:DNA polymerase III epsilon subunit family exonuclease
MANNISNCPECHAFRSVSLENDHLTCDTCAFNVKVLCPFCSVGTLKPMGEHDLICERCQVTIQKQRLAYIFSNKLQVNTEERCEYCHRPTLYRDESNISPRCFEHPNCGNQIDLFGEDRLRESYVFIDLETTGLEIGTESIIEIGACKVSPTGQETFFQEFVKPVKPVSAFITKITGISDDMVVNAPKLKPVLSALVDFCGDAHWVAHNAQFDVPWLLLSLLRHDYPIPVSKVLCTLKWAKTKEEGRRSLGALSKKYNIGHENAHRALADAVVTKSLFYTYQNQTEDIPIESIDRYLDISKKIFKQAADFIQT